MFANNKNYFLISSSFILTYAIYLVSIQVSKIYPTLIVPSGDPFSYEVSLISLYNYSTFSVSNYFNGIIDTITSGQWYYAYKLPIALFSPFLSSNHNDLLIVNYFYLLILILIIQITLSYINKNNIVNLLSLIVIFLFPYLWGYKSIISINQLSLDTQVFLVSISYFFLLVSYYHKYSSTKLSILVSILGGFLFWTRGNAFTFFIILTIPTFLLFFFKIFKV
jgi:Cation transport ATPase